MIDSQRIPYSQEAEESCLGALLTNPSLLPLLESIIQPDSYFLLRHRHIAKAIQRTADRDGDYDYLTVAQALKEQGKLDEVGGQSYLLYLVNNTPSTANAEIYAHIVQRAAIRRKLLVAGDAIKALALKEDMDVEQVLSEAESEMNKVRQESISNDETGVGVLLSQRLAFVQERVENPSLLPGLPVGLKGLDNLLGGFQRSDLIVIAGPRGVGKTALMLTMLHYLSRHVGTGMISLEMGAEQLVDRLISIESSLNLQQVRFGNFKPDSQQWTRYVEAVGRVNKHQFRLFDRPATPEIIRAKALQWRRETALSALFVDYLQIITSNGQFRGQRTQEVGYFSRSLKGLAKELHCPVIAGAQLSREGVRGEPELHHLRESGDIENDADVVILLWAPDEHDPNWIRAKIAKHRNGPTGAIDLWFERDCVRYRDARRMDLEAVV
ncbi:MAG: replicative DNA helicase [Anaerolineae bacterium]|nr:replicative DNA helicase [Anaerolineae bacterium]